MVILNNFTRSKARFIINHIDNLNTSFYKVQDLLHNFDIKKKDSIYKQSLINERKLINEELNLGHIILKNDIFNNILNDNEVEEFIYNNSDKKLFYCPAFYMKYKKY